ncbi:FAD/NAD(P)-binding protein [Sphingobium subterraneum]|uniref:Putative NAD(P)/FAD-binding protein YdhS n=1 Tax=Sphingobium subterraneum TaxID=627688 RepID=A0A841J8J1_9SPHN|nr:FAD/NAD(P)-binding protein [Sphingobium subterraneum]MBB6124868.1 putative NAD(P)/FAD-binding protein YdhS [Sphingobium subterraneum]
MFAGNEKSSSSNASSLSPGVRPAGQRVAIVGCGASGVYALHAILRVPHVSEVVIFESDDLPGPGLPYHPRYNDRQALANIAGFEIPPLVESLNAWAMRQPVSRLRDWGIEDSAADDRAFFPRIVLGAWFADQFALIRSDPGSGKFVITHPSTEVTDIIALPGGCHVSYRCADGSLADEPFDRVIVATGYGSNGSQHPKMDHDPELLTGKAAASAVQARSIAILGTSLSGIDAAVSVAMARGHFQEENGRLRYSTDDSWRMVMMSRRGILPEADFWFPYPPPQPHIFTHEAVDSHVDGRDGDLDRLFELFVAELTLRDPDHARRIDLSSANADNFADRYFAPRASGDPIAYARANLAEAIGTHASQQTSAWRHTILQAHEIFGAVLPRFSEADFGRFQRGLKQVFTDNYAAVPHLSIERVLALADAGVLQFERLGPRYRIDPTQDGQWCISAAPFRQTFDALIDARGQQTAAIDTLPFPTLRLQLCAAANAEGEHWGNGLSPDSDFTMAPRDPTWGRVHLCALPYLLTDRPFVQGLIECAQMANAVARAISADVPADQDDIDLKGMLQHLENGPTIVLGNGAVVSL